MKDKLKVLSVPTTTALVHNLSSIHGKREIEGGREKEAVCDTYRSLCVLLCISLTYVTSLSLILVIARDSILPPPPPVPASSHPPPARPPPASPPILILLYSFSSNPPLLSSSQAATVTLTATDGTLSPYCTRC